MLIAKLDDVRRMGVADRNGDRVFQTTDFTDTGVEVHLSEDGRTLRIYPITEYPLDPDYWQIFANVRGRITVHEVYAQGEWVASFRDATEAQEWVVAEGGTLPPTDPTPGGARVR